MIILSTIFDEKVAPDIDYALCFLSLEFAESLKNVGDAFKGFHSRDELNYPQEERAIIHKMEGYILQNVELLFNAIYSSFKTLHKK